jgi:Ca2+-binding EF-hand superfamily protein
MNDGFVVMAKVLRYRTLDDMHAIFDEQDRDHSGTMDAKELLQLFASLSVNLTEDEVDMVLDEVPPAPYNTHI